MMVTCPRCGKAGRLVGNVEIKGKRRYGCVCGRIWFALPHDASPVPMTSTGAKTPSPGVLAGALSLAPGPVVGTAVDPGALPSTRERYQTDSEPIANMSGGTSTPAGSI